MKYLLRKSGKIIVVKVRPSPLRSRDRILMMGVYITLNKPFYDWLTCREIELYDIILNAKAMLT